MKPMHATVTKISRCPCCQSSYSRHSMKPKSGKTAARQKAKREMKKEMN